MAKIAFLECTKCGEHISAEQPQNVCPRDGGSLYARYDLQPLAGKPEAREVPEPLVLVEAD